MDENTIFQSRQTSSPPSPLSSEGVSPSTPQVKPVSAAIPGQASPPIAKSPGQSLSTGSIVPPPPVEESSSIIPLLLRAGIGFLTVVVVVFLVIRFVVPLFGSKSNEKVTVSYWGLWEDASVMQSLITEFQKANPNITVVYSKEDPKQYRERLVTRIKNSTGPDIFRYHNTWVPQLSTILLPLPTSVISGSDFKQQYYSAAQKDLIKNGAVYGIPLGIDTLALFLNKEALQAAGVTAPTTWEDFASSAKALAVKDETGKIKTAGAALGAFDNITHAPDIISLLLLQNGADLQSLNTTVSNASDALQFYVSFTKDEGKVWDETLDPSILAFAKGNLAMYFGYSWDIFTIKALNKDLVFEIVPVPHLPNRDITVASYWVEGVSQKTKHQKESLKFMQFLAKKETVQKLFTEQSKTRLFGTPYARVDLASTVKDNIYLSPFLSQAQGAMSSFFASDTYDNGLNSQMNGYLGNAVRAILSNTSPESAVETLSQGVSQVLSQYGQ